MRLLCDDDWSKLYGFPDYAISTSGRLLSYKRGDWRELHPYVSNKGYKYVNLRRNGQTERYYVHRLVADTFIPNPENKRAVNHIDGDKLNNDVSNLEWVTYQENSKHAYAHGLSYLPDPEIALSKIRTRVVATNMDTGYSREFDSQRDASLALGISPPHLNQALRGSCPHAKRYTFKYLDEVAE